MHGVKFLVKISSFIFNRVRNKLKILNANNIIIQLHNNLFECLNKLLIISWFRPCF